MKLGNAFMLEAELAFYPNAAVRVRGYAKAVWWKYSVTDIRIYTEI